MTAASPAMTQTDASFWNAIAEKYSRDRIADMDSYEATLARVRAHLKPGDRVLELGCGTGSTALRLADAVTHYTGTDIASEMIRIARGKAGGIGNLTFETGVAEDDALAAPASLDAVLSFNHLHLVEDPRATIRAGAAMLKPGGLFMSKTVCMQSSLKMRMLKPLIGVMKALGKAPGTVRFFTTEQYDAMFREAGFELIETGFYAFPRRFVVARKL